MAYVSPIGAKTSQEEPQIDNPIALITGGSRGLGKEMVRSIAGSGADVILTYQSSKADAFSLVAEVEKMGRRAAALQLDMGDFSSFATFAEEVRGVLRGWGPERFDFLVNNAGHGLGASIEETTEEQFDEIMDVHLKGPFFLTQKLLQLIADGGRIVNVSSALARHGVTFPGGAAYASAKGAVEVMTRYMAREFGPRGISVNAISPGGIETDFGGGMMRDPGMQEMVTSITALGRVGQPEDVGGVVASLLSPKMGWVSGQHIEVSGGQNL